MLQSLIPYSLQQTLFERPSIPKRERSEASRGTEIHPEPPCCPRECECSPISSQRIFLKWLGDESGIGFLVRTHAGERQPDPDGAHFVELVHHRTVRQGIGPGFRNLAGCRDGDSCNYSSLNVRGGQMRNQVVPPPPVCGVSVRFSCRVATDKLPTSGSVLGPR